MGARRGRMVLAVVTAGAALAGCTDNTGAIDQKGHNGYDKMACTSFTSMAREAQYGALTPTQALDAALQVAATAQRAGSPDVRAAGGRLADAYRTQDSQAVTAAIAAFKTACTW
jgi:hypothetical protein